jgi:putative membrane-bound dehydrogenase-like protein
MTRVPLAFYAFLLALRLCTPLPGAEPAPKKEEAKKEEPKKEQPKLPTPSPSSPDWKLEVLFEKPKIHLPSVVCTIPDGRILVAEDPMDQFGPGNKPIDRVLCIWPDGKITVFADKLYAVFGLAYIDGKVHIHHSPKYTVYEDDPTAGIGKNPVNYYESDNPATWGGGNLNDHIPAQIRLGMDGWLYMSVGDKGIYGLVSNIDKSAVELRGGGVIRFWPDGTNFEVYSTGTRNHLDLSINAEDEIFSYDNTDDGRGWNTRFTHMVDGGFYGYPYDYRPHESDAEGMAGLNEMRSKAGKARQEWEKAQKEKPEKDRSDKDKPSDLPPPFYGHTLWAMTDFGGGSPCGAVGYNEDALPEEYRGNLFHCEWGKKQIERIVVERAGGTYKIVKRDDKFLKGGTQPFRPLGICVTQDGMGFLIADWNWDGWNSKNDAGRLMKLTYTGKSHAQPKPRWFVPAAMGQKFQATTQELVEALKHPAQSVRLVAQRRVAERGAEAVPLLAKLVEDKTAPDHARWSAIWSLDGIEGGKAGRDAVIAVLKDSKQDVTVRMQAARQLGTRKTREAVPALVAALSDADAALRFRAATALGRIGDARAVQPLLDNLADPDLLARFATFTALNRIGKTSPSAWDAIVRALSSENAKVREGTAYAMRNTYDAALVAALSNYVTQTSNPAHGRIAGVAAIAPLFKQSKPWNGKWWGTQPVNGLPPALEIEWAGTAGAQNALRTALDDPNPAVRRAAIVALRTAPDPAAGDRLVQLFKAEGDLPTRKDVLRALAAIKSPGATALAVEILGNTKANADLLPETMKLAAVLGGPQMLDALVAMLGGDVPVDMLASACETLGKIKDAKAVPALSTRVAHKDEKVATAATNALGQITGDASLKALLTILKDARPSIRRTAALAIGSQKSKDAIAPLLAIYKDKDITKEVITALAATPSLKALDAYLDGLASSDASLRSTCRRAIRSIQKEALDVIEARLDTNPLPTQVISELQSAYQQFVPEDKRTSKLWKYDTKKLSPEAFANYAKIHPGKADAGWKMFRAQSIGCIKCHKVGNDGGDVGPALTGIGTKYDRQFLIESVLYPNRQILDGYQQTIVRLKDGDVQSGVVRSETDAEITLFDASAEKLVIQKAEVAEREHSKLSVMPEGLHTGLKPEEFADLIGYLESLKDNGANGKK